MPVGIFHGATIGVGFRDLVKIDRVDLLADGLPVVLVAGLFFTDMNLDDCRPWNAGFV